LFSVFVVVAAAADDYVVDVGGVLFLTAISTSSFFWLQCCYITQWGNA